MSADLKLVIERIVSTWESDLRCAVYVNQRLVQTLPISAAKHGVFVPDIGQLRIEVYQGVHPRAVTIVELSCLPLNQTVSLPLRDRPECLTTVPYTCTEPYLNLSLHSPAVLAEDLSKQLVSCKNQLAIERLRREQQDSKILTLAHEYQNCIKRAHARESRLLEELGEAHTRVRTLTEQLQYEEQLNRQLKAQCAMLEETVVKYDITISGVLESELKEELLVVKEALQESEDSRTELQKALSGDTQRVSPADQCKLENQLEILKMQLANTREDAASQQDALQRTVAKLQAELQQHTEKHSVDFNKLQEENRALQERLIQQGNAVKEAIKLKGYELEHVSHNVFKHKGKKVSVYLIEEHLVVSTGTELFGLKQFAE